MSTEDQPFDHPALSDVYKALKGIEEVENQLQVAKQQLQEAIIDLPTRIGENEDLHDEIFHQLYWFRDDIPTSWLKEVFHVIDPSHAKKGTSSKLIKGAQIEIQCVVCDNPFYIEVTSRSDLQTRRGQIKKDHKSKGLLAGWATTCKECKARGQKYMAQWSEQQRVERQTRLNFLHTMPYKEYLQTTEWQVTRKKAMKRAGFRCQVCNAYGVRLNVHHRTYEQRGHESNQDVIVLCEKCHGIFHESGKLAKEVEV